ncbi:hypothetical protein M436DRAFT_61152 [Aureobasidium namibiae CBS 147.97]|uniref:Uncharacterized protein n=1 Tax=Aureobasidium namibiae CBS 147.97 TaxID=1043004 RepID=A0A074WRN6_9PEZI
MSRPNSFVTESGSEQEMASADPEAIATGTFKSVFCNLKQHGFRTSQLRFYDLQGLLSKFVATQQQLSILLAPRNFFLILHNGGLTCILELEPSIVTSPFTRPGPHYYFHSFEKTRYQLEKSETRD